MEIYVHSPFMLSCRRQGQLYVYVIVYVIVQKCRDPEDGSITLLRHVGNYLTVDTKRHPRRLKSFTSTTVYHSERLPLLNLCWV